jgi:chromosome segregation ATPase
MDESVNRNRYDSQEALIREIEADRDALRTELEAAQRRLEVACHIKAEDKVSFDFAVLDELAALREWKEELGKRLNTCPEHILDIISDWEDTLDELEELREQARWIPVTERLPKDEQTVLLTNGKVVETGDHYSGDWWQNRQKVKNITHWRPLPPAPAEGGEG